MPTQERHARGVEGDPACNVRGALLLTGAEQLIVGIHDCSALSVADSACAPGGWSVRLAVSKPSDNEVQAESSAEDAKALVKTVPRSSNLLFPTTSSWRLAQVLRRALRVQFGNEAASVGSHGWPSAKFNSVNKL
eukprot:CAMPEP_0206423746 /NCGR_PEP_ID=MMETSP0324_2-20121206/2840_1 /ASSEMBLY_ACC=CAM_ASM_000836 /TAXON_ID=2866 /ORGANISM="Crypthecodinium cohnii, Strain Seligo" /LENGTH=134 /DNA_ID=CAMNT_0053888317 /DNA_START=188 /DNA_END=593 /DNA_ORIENTATION=-